MSIRIDLLVDEASRLSNLHNKLNPSQQDTFRRSVKVVVDQVAASKTGLKLVKTVGFMTALQESGADELLSTTRRRLVNEFDVAPQALGPALTKTTAKVLRVLASGDDKMVVADLEKNRRHSLNTNSEGTTPGRTLGTTDVQPPNTGARTLRRR